MSRILEGLSPEIFDVPLQAKAPVVPDKRSVKTPPAVTSDEAVIKVSVKPLTMRQYAHFLQQNYIVDVGRQRLYDWFRKEGVIPKDSRKPNRVYIEQGLFEVRYADTASPNRFEPVALISPLGQKTFTKAILDAFKKH